MRSNETLSRAAFRAVKRLCYAGLDSITLRSRVVGELARAIPSDGYTFATTDPDTGLLTHAVGRGVPESSYRLWTRHLYPNVLATELLDMVRRGQVVDLDMSVVVRDLLRPEGFGHDLRAVLAGGEDAWGFVCLLRETGTAGFDTREAELLRRLAPHLTRGLQAAEARGTPDRDEGDAGTEWPSASREGADRGAGAGVVVLDAGGRLRSSNPRAHTFLADLSDEVAEEPALPHAVMSAFADVRHRLADEARDPDAPLEGRLRARGRSGQWYRILATPAEQVEGTPEVIVLVEPAGPSEIAPHLARLYGLTPREREVVAGVARGRSTKAIASSLGISPWTVQEHVGNACARVGVRTRRELVARLFLDGFRGGVPA